MKKTAKIITSLVAAVLLIFLLGRYGWKICGFAACHDAGICAVKVSEKAVHITGFYPGSFPEGCCGYYAKEKDGKLYVGFRFSAVFGIFEDGDFDIKIPVKETVDEVIVKTRMRERTVWNADTGFVSQSEPYGVFVKMESNDSYFISMSYKGINGEEVHTEETICDSGKYFFMDNDIVYVAKETEAAVPFSITVKAVDGAVVAYGEFAFDIGKEKMYLTIDEDGRMTEE